MARIDVWPVIFAERTSLAADLQGTEGSKWDTASLCNQWTVRDVIAHMTATAKITPLSFFGKMAGSGFRFAKMQAKDIAAERGTSPVDTLSLFKAIETSTKRPPGPADTMLGEVLIHSEDVRRPLGIKHSYPAEALVQAADFFKGSNLIIGTKSRIAGLSLRATDMTWTHGSGPEVAGTMLDLLMSMTGRKAAMEDLTGEGAAILRTRK